MQLCETLQTTLGWRPGAKKSSGQDPHGGFGGTRRGMRVATNSKRTSVHSVSEVLIGYKAKVVAHLRKEDADLMRGCGGTIQ